MADKIKVLALRSVKYEGKYYEPKQSLDIPEELAIQLSKMDPPAVQLPFVESVKEETPIDETPVDDGVNDDDKDELTEEEVVELFTQIDELEEDLAKQLFGLGIDSLSKLKDCTLEDLQQVNGIGPATSVKLFEIIAEVEEEVTE